MAGPEHAPEPDHEMVCDHFLLRAPHHYHRAGFPVVGVAQSAEVKSMTQQLALLRAVASSESSVEMSVAPIYKIFSARKRTQPKIFGTFPASSSRLASRGMPARYLLRNFTLQEPMIRPDLLSRQNPKVFSLQIRNHQTSRSVLHADKPPKTRRVSMSGMEMSHPNHRIPWTMLLHPRQVENAAPGQVRPDSVESWAQHSRIRRVRPGFR